MVQPRLLAILSEQLYYDEIAIPFTRMQNECKQLISLLADSNIDLQDRLHCSVFTIDQANELVSLHSKRYHVARHNTAHNTTHSTPQDTAHNNEHSSTRYSTAYDTKRSTTQHHDTHGTKRRLSCWAAAAWL